MKSMYMKSNYICWILAFVLMPLYLDAQNVKRFKYQGEVDVAYSFGIDDETNNMSIEMINGVRFSRYLYAGVGLGAAANLADEAVIIPIYADVKGYLPVSDKLDLTAGLDIGTKLDCYYDMSGGLLFRPEFGLHFPMKRNFGMKLTMFYELYSYKTTILNTTISYKTNQLGLKLGFSF